MRKLSALIMVVFCFFCFAKCKEARASEALLTALQEQVTGLSDLVKSLQTTVQSQSKLIESQGAKIVYLEGSLEKGAALPKPASEPAGAPKMSGLSQGLNPEIGLVASIQANSTESTEDGEGNDTIALKEAELSISQYVDPFSRLDGIIAFNDNLEEQNVDVEELYYTHWGIPLGFRGQIGKFRSKIGKTNLLHSHQLDTVDYPLVIRDFFGEHGLSSSGARLQNMIPNPFDIPIEVTGEILRGNNGTSFSGVSRRPIFNSHVSTFFQTSENTNLEVGGTAIFGDENPAVIEYDGESDVLLDPEIPEAGSDKYGVRVFGADATFKWDLPEGRSIKWQNEIYFQNRGSNTRHANLFPWGFYSLIDHRLSKRFSVGLRVDYVEPLDFVDHDTVGVSPYITFWQSEFANFRLQYSYTKPADGALEPNNEVFLKANVLIGAHRHPVQ